MPVNSLMQFGSVVVIIQLVKDMQLCINYTFIKLKAEKVYGDYKKETEYYLQRINLVIKVYRYTESDYNYRQVVFSPTSP